MARHAASDDPSENLTPKEKAQYLKDYAKNVRKGNIKLPSKGKHQAGGKDAGKNGKK